MNKRRAVMDIRAEIFARARQSADLDTMHWYMWLDDCFENDEFRESEFSNVQWRIAVLRDRNPLRTMYLIHLLTRFFQEIGLVDQDGRPIPKGAE